MTQLEQLAQMCAALGFSYPIEQVPTDTECAIHGAPLVLSRTRTLNGWQGVTSCPAFDGTCRWDPNASPDPTDEPDTDEPDTAEAEPHNPT